MHLLLHTSCDNLASDVLALASDFCCCCCCCCCYCSCVYVAYYLVRVMRWIWCILDFPFCPVTQRIAILQILRRPLEVLDLEPATRAKWARMVEVRRMFVKPRKPTPPLSLLLLRTVLQEHVLFLWLRTVSCRFSCCCFIFLMRHAVP